MIEKQNFQNSIETTIVGNTVLPAVDPLINNRRWYAKYGTIYNEADEEVRIVLLHNSGSYSNLPNDITEMIASALNSK